MSRPLRHKVYVALGSNLGDRQGNIAAALRRISELPDTLLTKASPLYETDPVGGPPQDKYLNGAAELLTTLEPRELLEALAVIERGLGRTSKGKNLPRPIDLDILLFDDIIHDDGQLIIPHPRMREREFVMKPLRDIQPQMER